MDIFVSVFMYHFVYIGLKRIWKKYIQDKVKDKIYGKENRKEKWD